LSRTIKWYRDFFGAPGVPPARRYTNFITDV